MSLATSLSMQQVADVLGLSKRHAARRAQEESWPVMATAERGKLLYAINELPVYVQAAIARKRMQENQLAGDQAGQQQLVDRAMQSLREEQARRMGWDRLDQLAEKKKELALAEPA